MPDSVLTFQIANGDPNPNGNGAKMSISGNGQPNQAQWRSDDDDYRIGLPANVWNVTANEGNSYFFDLAANSTSPTFTLLSTAPTGLQGYAITMASIEGGEKVPQVDVDP
jgi:hypothetical protein